MKTVTILGNGPSWKLCPLEGEVWASATAMLVDGMEDAPLSRVFAFDRPRPRIRESIELAKGKGIPVWSRWGYGTNIYPMAEVTRKFKTAFLKNTVSYMIALALYEDYEKIWMFGFDPTDRLDYNLSKAFITYWIGRAEERGAECLMNFSSMRWFRGTYGPRDKC